MAIIISVIINPLMLNAKYRYAKGTINIRAKPNTKSKIVGQVYWNDKIKLVKRANKKWYQIRYKKHNRYICSRYLRRHSYKYKAYTPVRFNSFKSYMDADCITNNTLIPQGSLKRKYHLDYKTGIWMVGNRYCIAVGSYYTKQVGVKIDLVLSHNGRKHTLKCITADCKSDRDTVDKHRICKDGSIVEFIVNTSTLSNDVRRRGDVSYSGIKFRGNIETIKVYTRRK